MSERVLGDTMVLQQLPRAQQRCLATGRVLSLFCAQQWHVRATLLTALNLTLLKAVQPLRTEVRLDVEADDGLVGLMGERCQVVQVFGERRDSARDRGVLRESLERDPLVVDLRARLAVDPLLRRLPAGVRTHEYAAKPLRQEKIDPSPAARARPVILLIPRLCA